MSPPDPRANPLLLGHEAAEAMLTGRMHPTRLMTDWNSTFAPMAEILTMR